MKLIVADDVTYIGSANYDARSIFINLEIMLRYPPQAAAVQCPLLPILLAPHMLQRYAKSPMKLRWRLLRRWSPTYHVP